MEVFFVTPNEAVAEAEFLRRNQVDGARVVTLKLRKYGIQKIPLIAITSQNGAAYNVWTGAISQGKKADILRAMR